MHTIYIHVFNEEPVLGEVENLPAPTDNTLTVLNPRKRDGKDLPYLLENVTTVIWSMNRIAFIEVIPGEDEEQIIGFVRE